MSDNTTPHMADEYDEKVHSTIPCFENFHRETIDLIEHVKPHASTWLDAGGGTGLLLTQAVDHFPATCFVLADPSPQMLAIAAKKLANHERVKIVDSVGTAELPFLSESFEVITAIQSHHYMDKQSRKLATTNCYRMLAASGLYVTFENIRPFTESGREIGLSRWVDFQISSGKSREDAENHRARFDTEYFPITIQEHLDLLRGTGFSVVEILWVSYMQAGFYAIK